MTQPIHTLDDDKPPYQAGPVRVGTFQDNDAIAPYWFIETAYDTHELGRSRITQGQMDDSPWAYANARLLAAAYNAFDSAAKRSGLNAVEMAERMQDGGIGELIAALERLCLEYGSFLGADGDTLVPFDEPPDTAIAQARAILAKVKGGKP